MSCAKHETGCFQHDIDDDAALQPLLAAGAAPTLCGLAAEKLRGLFENLGEQCFK